jgi:dihydroorotase
MNRVVWEAPVVDQCGVRREQLVIEDGRVAQRGDLGLSADKVWSDQHLLFPGFGDIHVHLREGQEYKEDYQTGSQAALNGGVTFCCDMPNNPVSPVDAETLARKQAKVPDGDVHIELYAALGPGTVSFGAKRYKAFLAHSTGPLFFRNLQEAKKVIAGYSGCQITFHCECPELLEAASGQPTHEERRPEEAEVEAVRHVLRWVKDHGIIANVAHVSSLGALRLLEAQSEVTFEVTPHHMFFDTENRSRFQRGDLLKMNPPLRGPETRKALLKAFLQGKVPFLATDHAPHTLEEKLGENPPSGIPLLDTYGLFVTWLLKEAGAKPEVIYSACCDRPAQFLSLEDRGHLRPGARADAVVLDLGTPHEMRAEDIATKCAWSPFEGFTFPGSVDSVFVAGRAVRRRSANV